MKDEHKYNGFYYFHDLNEGIIGIEHNKNIPDFVFKFFGFSQYNIEALTKGYLYAAHPYELNDIFDHSVFFSKVENNIPYKRYLEMYDGLDIEKINEIFSVDQRPHSFGRVFLAQNWETTSNQFGTISFTEKENNLLMWPHYTNEKGFQLKFNLKSLEDSINKHFDGAFLGTYPINYTNKLTQMDISQFQSGIIPFIYGANVKLDTWKYEEEWRMYVSRPRMGIPRTRNGLNPYPDWPGDVDARKIPYNPNVIEEIAIGANFFNGHDFEVVRVIENYDVTEESIFKIRETNENRRFCKDVELFLDTLVKDYNDCLYISAIKVLNSCFERSKERVIIEKIQDKTYRVIRAFEPRSFSD